jgi:hypothetical protein
MSICTRATAIPVGTRPMMRYNDGRGDPFTSNCPVFTYWFFPDEEVTLTDNEPDNRKGEGTVSW